ncbi:hypothetical protein HOD30_02170 [Candidatus Peregrinibacteria bacterium]|jgi:hypothetical protein|nr:hypothetical protein [Candidatus Peregrinibacteria bacterium]MBT4631581.1 hypothetical protein [Candidatus Peregrinibacteria bacterium]MBT5517203.1 hypothetical protein [Candidatus Peregrinibacteria bacterium]MBT5824122.1 hypothetical protein [Candidatus Peregrinibacteria bacterium]
MKNKRGKTPSLITASSGRPEKSQAKKLRNCTRCKEAIVKGTDCFLIPKKSGGFTSKKSFCNECFREILEQSKKDLGLFEELLLETEGS